jgi:hypothetical protein
MSDSAPTPLPPRALPVSGADLLLILIVALGSVRLLAGLIVALAPPPLDDGPGLPLVLGVLLFQTLAILGAIRFVVLRKYGLRWADLGLRPSSSKWILRGLALAVLLLVMVVLINGILIPMVTDGEFHNPQLVAVAPDGFSWPALISMLVMAGVVAPFGEELVFRGLLFPWLRGHLGVIAAAVLSGLIFATLHGVPILIPALTAIGTALALLYHRCGSLWPVILAHGAFNGIMVSLLYAALAAGLELP